MEPSQAVTKVHSTPAACTWNRHKQSQRLPRPQRRAHGAVTSRHNLTTCKIVIFISNFFSPTVGFSEGKNVGKLISRLIGSLRFTSSGAYTFWILSVIQWRISYIICGIKCWVVHLIVQLTHLWYQCCKALCIYRCVDVYIYISMLQQPKGCVNISRVAAEEWCHYA